MKSQNATQHCISTWAGQSCPGAVDDKVVAMPPCATEDDYEAEYFPPECLACKDEITEALANMLCYKILNLRRLKKALAINQAFGITMRTGDLLFTKPFVDAFLKKAREGSEDGQSPFTGNELAMLLT
jgi:hypothetical protein